MDNPNQVFDEQHRGLTVGVLLGVTIIAFEALAVVTVAPQIAGALSGMALYGWIFSAFLLASLLGITVGGQQADRRGPGLPFLVGVVLFGTGLLISGFAPTMAFLILGRAVQGLGSGALVTCFYLAINLAYADALRPRMMALLSSAWVLPGLLGPSAAGFVADLFGWRVVFWGMVPPLILVALLTARAFLNLEGNGQRTNRLRPAAGLVLGAGLLLGGLTLSTLWLAGFMVIGGAALAVPSLKALLPQGTLTLGTGLGAVVATRGLMYAAFVATEAFLVLALTEVHGLSASLTGVVIATGAVSWTAGSWLQDRWDERSPENEHDTRRCSRLALGTLILSVGIGVQLLALFINVYPLLITVLGWLLCGLGIGVAHSTSSVLAFAFAPRGEEGAVSASLQIADQLTSALSTGIGGAVLATAVSLQWGQQLGIAVIFGINLLLVGTALLAAYRVKGQQHVNSGSATQLYK